MKESNRPTENPFYIDEVSYREFLMQIYDEKPCSFDWERLSGITYHWSKRNDDKPTLYFDMDGVLAKWQTHKADGTPIVFDEDILPEYKHYYRDVPCNEFLCSIVNDLCERDDINVRILSKATKGAIRDKLLWLQDIIPNISLNNVVLVPYTELANKSNFIPCVNNRTVLFEDYTPNQIEFEKAGGLSVNVLNGINRFDMRFINIDIQDKELMNEIESIIDVVKDKSLSMDDYDSFEK